MVLAGHLTVEVNTVSDNTTTEWQSKILLQIAGFLSLPEKPQGEWRVKRPTASAYRAAVDLITEIKAPDLPLPKVSPDREGGIQFEWKQGGLEIGILPTGAYEYLRVNDAESEEGHAGLSKAREMVASLAGN
jgi:hypothetical protein